ncbi:MAG: glycosyltransferase [Polaribacter sp.]
MKKLVIVQTVTPDYRAVFFDTIQAALGNRFELYAGDFYFQKSIKSDNSIEKRSIKNFYFFGRKLLFQFGLMHLLFNNDALVLEMNPRILSNWIILIFRKITNKETILWGHAWPREGQSSKTNRLRKIMQRLASQIVVYTNTQRDELAKVMSSKTILSATNSVISSKDMTTNADENGIKNILFIGRLVADKKPLFLLQSFHSIIESLPKTTSLIIAGEGPESEKLQQYIIEHNLEKRVFLKGHVGNYEELKKLYFQSLFSTSPGYVGLSAIQSFGFGVPMLVSKDENHSPEIEAVNEWNSTFFETDNIDSCGIEILKYFKNKNKWVSTREKIVEHCKKNYSAENMTQTFIKLVK